MSMAAVDRGSRSPSPGTTTHRRLPPVICLNGSPWDTPWWIDRHYLMSGLTARGWPVVFSQGARSIWDRDKDEWAEAPWLGRFEAVRFGANDLLVDRAGRLPPRWPRAPWYDRLVCRYEAMRLRRAFPNAARQDAIAFVCALQFEPYIEALGARHVVFHIHDAFWKNRDWTALQEERLRRIVRRADLIVAVSESMIPCAVRGSGRRCVVIPHAVNVEQYLAGPEAPCPPDLAAVARPRIGYIGRVSRKIDLELVYEVARRRPDWNWVFVGEVGVGFGEGEGDWDLLARCKGLPNVFMLGPRPQAEMPRYMGHMDVNTMCYKETGGYWEAISPLKMFEYLATGRPVVGTGLENIRRFSDVIDIARTPDEWIAAIDRALSSGGVGTVAARRACAGQNTWQRRVDLLEECLLDLITREEPDPGSPRGR